MIKHTPAPWVTEQPEGKGYVWVSSSDGSRGNLATVWCADGNAMANARLMAAAPDLLEALKDSLDLITTISPLEGDTVKKARAAIAKATGEAA